MVSAVIQSNRDEFLFFIFKQGGHFYCWMFARAHACVCVDSCVVQCISLTVFASSLHLECHS